MKLSEVSFELFTEVFNENIKNGLESINRVLPDLTAIEEVELFGIIDDADKEAFESFKNTHPDIEFYKDVDGPIKKKNYWEITLQTLEVLYISALNLKLRKSYGNQIIAAKDLTFSIKDMNYNQYKLKKILFLKKYPGYKNELSIAERYFTTSFDKDKKAEVILGCFLDFCNRTKEDVDTLINHFFQRIRILSLDSELTNEENKKFYENLNTFYSLHV